MHAALWRPVTHARIDAGAYSPHLSCERFGSGEESCWIVRCLWYCSRAASGSSQVPKCRIAPSIRFAHCPFGWGRSGNSLRRMGMSFLVLVRSAFTTTLSLWGTRAGPIGVFPERVASFGSLRSVPRTEAIGLASVLSGPLPVVVWPKRKVQTGFVGLVHRASSRVSCCRKHGRPFRYPTKADLQTFTGTS